MPRPDTDICAEPGCQAPRFKPSAMRGRSRFCEQHYKLHDKRYRAGVRARQRVPLSERVRQPYPQMPDTLTPGELLEHWATHEYGPTYGYEGRQVYGLRQLEDNAYRLILAGQNEYEYVDGTVPLRRLP